MLKIIEGFVSNEHHQLLHQMFCQRKAVFNDKKGWDVVVTGDWEIDEFDTPSTLYLLSVDDTGRVCGSVRLLSTAGIHMHNSVFKEWFGDIDIQSPNIWEATRFCIQSDLVGQQAASLACKEIMLGMFEIGSAHGWEKILSVYEAGVGVIYRRNGIEASVLAEYTTPHGLVKLGVADVDNRQLEILRDRTGLHPLAIEYAYSRYRHTFSEVLKKVA